DQGNPFNANATLTASRVWFWYNPDVITYSPTAPRTTATCLAVVSASPACPAGCRPTDARRCAGASPGRVLSARNVPDQGVSP
ncbi:hypothetical protein ACWC4J_20395, partial [Streptomyces sp. NPDC001356]